MSLKRSHSTKDALAIPDAVATASGVVLAIVIVVLPGGDNIHKLLPGIIGPVTIVVRYCVARWVRGTTLQASEDDLKRLREEVLRVEIDPNASPVHKKRMRAVLETAEERQAIDLTE